MTAGGGTSRVELLEASGPWWSPFLALVICIAFCAVCALLVYPVPTWRVCRRIWLRGKAYRRAQHRRRTSLHHLTFRSPVR